MSFLNKLLKYINKNIYTEEQIEILKNKIQLNEDTSSETENLFFSNYGYVRNKIEELSKEELQKIFIHSQFKEKMQIALSVVASYWGGDYLEFGVHDLYTFKNFLAAFHAGNLDQRYPDAKFYGFDIFGSYKKDHRFRRNGLYSDYDHYFNDFTTNGDIFNEYKKSLKKFGLFYERIELHKGLFDETLKNFNYDRKIGFAFLDCNIVPSYKTVLSWLEDRVDNGTFIYLDEYFISNSLCGTFEEFKKIQKKRNLHVVYIRAASGVGALFRCLKY